MRTDKVLIWSSLYWNNEYGFIDSKQFTKKLEWIDRKKNLHNSWSYWHSVSASIVESAVETSGWLLTLKWRFEGVINDEDDMEESNSLVLGLIKNGNRFWKRLDLRKLYLILSWNSKIHHRQKVVIVRIK